MQTRSLEMSRRLMRPPIFIVSIAALFLATGTAHALYPSTFLECGKTFVRIDHDKGTAPDGTRVFPRTWSIMEDAPRGARMTELGSFKFTCNVKDQWELGTVLAFGDFC